jgi:hypothetical protein
MNDNLILKLKAGVCFTTSKNMMQQYGAMFSFGRYSIKHELYFLQEVDPKNQTQKSPLIELNSMLFGRNEIELIERHGACITIPYDTITLI